MIEAKNADQISYEELICEYAEIKAKYAILRILEEKNLEKYEEDCFKVKKADILAALDGKTGGEENRRELDKDKQENS